MKHIYKKGDKAIIISGFGNVHIFDNGTKVEIIKIDKKVKDDDLLKYRCDNGGKLPCWVTYNCIKPMKSNIIKQLLRI